MNLKKQQKCWTVYSFNSISHDKICQRNMAVKTSGFTYVFAYSSG